MDGRDEIRRRAIALHDAFTHEHRDRRRFMAELATLAGGTAAAAALAGSIAADPAAAAIVPADDKRIKAANVVWNAAEARPMRGYMALPAKARGRLPAVIVVHENRGLNDHIRDVARRVALEGYIALAPDFLSASGGTPADEDAAREAIARLDLAQTVADGTATIRWLRVHRYSTGRIGAVGFCWGGATVNRLAVAAGDALAAAVPYYGPAPDPGEAPKVKAAMLLQLAGNDARVNATALPWGQALKAAGVRAEVDYWPGVDHAFNNDSSAERYDRATAEKAWARTTAFLAQHLKA